MSLAEVGLATVLVAPDPMAAWTNNYGAWRDELTDWGDIAEWTWPRAEVRLDAERVHVLERPYVRIDNRKLQAALRTRATAAGLKVMARSVVEAAHETAGSTLTLDDGGRLGAVLVVDATGHRPRLVTPGRGWAPGMQVAYGVRARLEQGVVDRHRMVLMDFTADHLAADDRDPPTFLYEMPLGDEDVFVEETSLVGRPALDLETCRRRLDRRMAARGWHLGPAKEVEHCFIPMGGPAPRPPQRVVPFGGAAAHVHPASGYMIANVLRGGPRLAAAVRAVRDRREPAIWSRVAWDAVLSQDRARAWALYRYGMEVLITLDVSSTAAFFDTFFRMPAERWQGYLSGDVGSGQVAKSMWALFVRASPKLRWILMSKGFYALMRGAPS